MRYDFILMEDFFKMWQIEYINLLNSCDLLEKFTPDSKKLFIYLFITNLNIFLKQNNLLFYHINKLTPELEIFNYIDYKKFNIFFNKVVNKIRLLTGRIFTIAQSEKSLVKQSTHLHELDGCIQDEILLLSSIELKPKNIKKFLAELNLSGIFKDMTWQCC